MKILLLTYNFPYLPGEQFLEDEIQYWAEQKSVELTIAPIKATGDARKIPSRVKLVTSLVRPRSISKYYLRGLFSYRLWQECLYLLRRRKISIDTLKEAAKSSILVEHAYDCLMAINEHYDVIYSYWNDASAYAAAMAKKTGKFRLLVSRAHGFDLYEDRRAGTHLPLKRQFIREFDQLFVISQQARRYTLSTFGDLPVTVSRLGVPVDERRSSPSPQNVLRILSVSFCVPVKRLDRIMDGVVEFSRSHQEMRVEWTHFGDGPLRQALIERAKPILQTRSNLQINFVGELPNQEVRQRMAEEPWDVLINASESEGVPVSIMEAMSFSIPAVATNVGGVGELVNSENGVLLRPNPNGKEIADALSSGLINFKSSLFRSQCKRKIETAFNAEINYREFIKQIAEMSNAISSQNR